MKRTAAWPLVALLPLAASCYAFNAIATVKARHSMETHCPDDQVSVETLEGGHYRAVGCGSRATYTCSPRSAGSADWECTREEEQDPGTVFGTTEGGDAPPEVHDSSHEDAGADAGRRDAGAADAGAPAEHAGADAGAPADPAASVRALIDAHASDVLGCTGRTSVGVHAGWDGRGVVTFGLPGDLAGRPEESCVRTALGPLTVPATTAGELIELVRH